MPLYAYRCPEGRDFEIQAPMGQIREAVPCPDCGQPAARKFTAPHLSRSSSSAYKLIESSARSASEPAVVTSPGAASGAPRGGGITHNPLHRKLPRPD
ncbi:zinc ribbon domain-containing protein [Arthrobacter sp. Sa2CUA1]|uniref:Zinc ribbon domain-containing protein n=1 Tax=Arthrobacter gallicola TaxID=2762225 RepID=A0ABR8UTF5_9MICC|nr:zinc ribbon domain-containing protein [Arthrobacter gallicola]MBD7995825.1 zinc ribbon domain-containing protein [Arthrobacter gallicola]